MEIKNPKEYFEKDDEAIRSAKTTADQVGKGNAEAIKSKVWEFIGKFAVIITIVGGILGIVNFLFPQRAKLIANGDYYAWIKPEELGENVFSNDNLLFENFYFSTDTPTTTDKINLNKIKSFWVIEIENKGKQEAKDIIFETSSLDEYREQPSGWYALNKTNDAKYFKNEIKLGNLKPSDKIILKIWSGADADKYIADKTKIKYTDGVTKIKYSARVGSTLAFIINNKYFYLFIFVILILLLIILKLVVVSRR